MTSTQARAEEIGPLGAWVDPEGGVRFRVWAPTHQQLDVVLHDARGQPVRPMAMTREERGYFSLHLGDGGPGLLYKLRVDGEGPFPDPWSRAQPFGVHGPSQVISDAFAWTDETWRGLRMEQLIVYELHVGTATPEGTFAGLIPKLKLMRDLGITAIELMPIASFPGARNWGYDMVSLFAPQATYGGPEGLRALIDAAHAHGLAVLLDVVFNHFGPDGNYLRRFSPHYFTGRHHTPWGEAVNYDGPHAAPVRELVLRNVEMWIRDYHADGLRLDATHAIVDDSTPPLLQQIQERAHSAAGDRDVVVIAEDERNDARIVTPVAQGGWGLDGVWADDFHHQMRRAFAGDHDGYYRDYSGTAADLARIVHRGWFYEGQHSVVRRGPRGTPAGAIEAWRLIHCIQNHDQIGNRAVGDRLHEAISPQALRAMTTFFLLTPYTPLLFQGQEWAASSRFQFFTDHHEELGRQVTAGRRKEFEHFERFHGEDVPDPQAPETFERSRLDWSERESLGHAEVLALHRELLRLRRTDPRLGTRTRDSFDAWAFGTDAVVLERRHGASVLQVVLNISGTLRYPLPAGTKVMLWSEEPRFGGALPDAPLEGDALVLDGPGAAVISLHD